MFLTYQVLPFFALLISGITFMLLQRNDPVNLNNYKDKVNGIPPIACCLFIVVPLIVLFAYKAVLMLGPKASRTGIKM